MDTVRWSQGEQNKKNYFLFRHLDDTNMVTDSLRILKSNFLLRALGNRQKTRSTFQYLPRYRTNIRRSHEIWLHKGDKKECIEPNTKCRESKNGAKFVFKHIVIHPHIQTAEVSILDGIKMEDFVWKLHDFGHSHNTWIKKTRLFSVHLLHPTHTHWPDKTKHRTTTFVFLSLLLESLVSIGSVWDRWSALIYSPAIYIHYAICLPNYDCGREGTGWLTLSFLSSQFLYELSFLAMFQKLVFSPTLLCWSLSLSIHLQPGVIQPLIYLWYRCPRVTKTLNLLTKIW